MANLRRLRRLPIMLAAILAVAAVPFATTAPPAAAEACYAQVIIPSRIAIDRYYRELRPQLRDTCGTVESAAFDLYGARGFDHSFVFDGSTTDYWDVYSFNDLGNFKTRDSYAYDADYNDIPVRETTTSIRLDTNASISSERVASNKVRLTVRASYYGRADYKYLPWSAPVGTIQYLSGTEWKFLKSVTMKGGSAVYTHTVPRVNTYRFVTGDVPTAFGSASTSTRR